MMKKKILAFSLIEVSVVILIIGIFIAGIFIANTLINKARLSAAKSLAKSSPIHNIYEIALWLETSLDESFNSDEAFNDSPITSWNDQKSSGNKVVISCNSTAGCPVYSNTINSIHAVEFNNAGFLEFDGSFLNNTDYTIIVLEKRKSSGSNNYFLGKTTSEDNNGIALGYAFDSTVIHNQGTNSYVKNSSVESYSSSKEKARIFTFVHSSTSGKKTYINGVLSAQDATNTSHLSGVTTIEIGKGYTGEIGEIVIFTKALIQTDIAAIEKYLKDKFKLKINDQAGVTCLSGTVVGNSCDNSLVSCSISIDGLIATVSPASTSTPLNCNLANYDNSAQINYTCINGTPTILSGSCPCATGYDLSSNCSSCASGYYDSDSGSAVVCSAATSCSTSSVIGVSTPTSVNHGDSGSLTCNASGYTGSTGPTYNCINGNLNLGDTSCACDSGKDIATNCSTCLSGYTEISGVCRQDCAIPNSTLGIVDGTTVVHGTTSRSCNAASYTGTITYTCTNSVINVTDNTCSTPCTASVSPTTYNGKSVFTFLSNGTFSCPTSRNVEVLVVGGGGAGGKATDGPSSGGGGGGGVVYASSYPITAGLNMDVTVGSGGINPGTGCIGQDGGNSTFGTLTAIGGGGGAGGYTYAHPCTGTRNAQPARNGGSGGASANNNTNFGTPGSSIQTSQVNGTSYHGNKGGDSNVTCPGLSSFNRCGGAGGGGAGSAGEDATSGKGGNGGNGIIISSISANYYGGGGGGSRSQSDTSAAVGQGGLGGGGNGTTTGSAAGSAGVANTGGGGGSGAAGGSGIVIIAY